VNIDSTLVAEAPKVLPHREAMQKKIGEALGLAPERIGIKATTNELLGAIGRQEGIAAMAVALIR
jgi:2-C-methyl-D-erythritol 2,4-cyclodiphosphate synthase